MHFQTTSYDTHYQRGYLESLSSKDLTGEHYPSFVKSWLMDVSDSAVKGYCLELLQYLADATKENPKRGFGTGRTAIWGIQRPPMLDGCRTLLRCGPNLSFDDMTPVFLLFYATNARSQVELSVDSANEQLLNHLKKHDLDNHIFKVVVEGGSSFEHRITLEGENFYNIVRVREVTGSDHDGSGGIMNKFPMPGQFVSLYLPMGHIKSTMKNDEEFVKYFGESEKWLKMAQ